MKVLLVDDHSVVRAGLRGMLTASGGIEVHEAANGEDALRLAGALRPNLIVLDLNLPGIGGLELLGRLLAEDGNARILVLSMHADPLYASRALEAGARGYLSKNVSPEELRQAARRIAAGGRYVENEIAQELALRSAAATDPTGQLSARDMEILRLLAAGDSMTEIATALGLSYKTVANACSQIKGKLGLARTADLIRFALETGLAAGRGQI